MPAVETVTITTETTDPQVETTSNTQEAETTNYIDIMNNLINKGKLIYSRNSENSIISLMICLFDLIPLIFKLS